MVTWPYKKSVKSGFLKIVFLWFFCDVPQRRILSRKKKRLRRTRVRIGLKSKKNHKRTHCVSSRLSAGECLKAMYWGGGRLSPPLPLSRPNRTDARWKVQKQTRPTFERQGCCFGAWLAFLFLYCCFLGPASVIKPVD